MGMDLYMVLLLLVQAVANLLHLLLMGLVYLVEDEQLLLMELVCLVEDEQLLPMGLV
jgi:hypothetical protein